MRLKEEPSLITHYDPWKDYTWEDSPGHTIQIEGKDSKVYTTAGEEGLYILDFENEPNRYRDTPIGEGDRNPVEQDRFDFEGILEHTYRNPEVKERKIRVELILIGSTGNCASGSPEQAPAETSQHLLQRAKQQS